MPYKNNNGTNNTILSINSVIRIRQPRIRENSGSLFKSLRIYRYPLNIEIITPFYYDVSMA